MSGRPRRWARSPAARARRPARSRPGGPGEVGSGCIGPYGGRIVVRRRRLAAWAAEIAPNRKSVMDRADQMQAWLRSRADEMAELLEELVAVDTENPPGRGLGECGSALRDAMDRLGLSPELIALSPSGGLEEP